MKKQAIAKTLRQKTGISLVKYAENLRVSRETIYKSMNGKGSRRIRVMIALDIGMPPSIIWNDNSTPIKLVDDLRFMEAQR